MRTKIDRLPQKFKGADKEIINLLKEIFTFQTQLEKQQFKNKQLIQECNASDVIYNLSPIIKHSSSNKKLNSINFP